jgi:hypothetical protein
MYYKMCTVCTITLFARTYALKMKKNVSFLLKNRGHLDGEGSNMYVCNVNKQKPRSPIGDSIALQHTHPLRLFITLIAGIGKGLAESADHGRAVRR